MSRTGAAGITAAWGGERWDVWGDELAAGPWGGSRRTLSEVAVELLVATAINC